MKIVKVLLFLVVAIGLILWGRSFNAKLDKQAVEKVARDAELAREARANVLAQLIKKDIVVGWGTEATSSSSVKVNYVGTFPDGEKFDSSYDRKTPLEFVLGKKMVIEGWDIGILGMKVGGKRELTVPPELAYGERGYGPIPPNTTLHFSVELLEVK